MRRLIARLRGVRLFRRRERHVCVEAVRIAMATDLVNRVLWDQSYLQAEDRDEQLNDVLLDVMALLHGQPAAGSYAQEASR